ncbi:uncharacterized protein [Montipora foliosa]|uniref:uncharacterized protein n=1 Tax=Montipora foliosa TaxID=591990 RepID=UPI0035F11A1A
MKAQSLNAVRTFTTATATIADREEGSVLVPVEDFFPPPASLKARKIGEKQAQMEPRTQQNIYTEGNPRDMEKNEGIMSVFNRYSLRTTFAIARNAKESKAFTLRLH